MKTIDTDAAESLRAFAMEHGEIAFAHLVTAALDGEEWAVERIEAVLRQVERSRDGAHAIAMLRIIRATDTTRPDGAIARVIEV